MDVVLLGEMKEFSMTWVGVVEATPGVPLEDVEVSHWGPLGDQLAQVQILPPRHVLTPVGIAVRIVAGKIEVWFCELIWLQSVWQLISAE